MTNNDLEMTFNGLQMTLRPKTTLPLCGHEKIFKSCRTFCPLTLIVLDLLVKNSDFGGGGPLWATVGPKREFSQIWLVDLFFKHIKEINKMS